MTPAPFHSVLHMWPPSPPWLRLAKLQAQAQAQAQAPCPLSLLGTQLASRLPDSPSKNKRAEARSARARAPLLIHGMATRCGILSKFFKISTHPHKSKQTHARAFSSFVPASVAWRRDALTQFLHDPCSLKCLREVHALLAVAGAIQETSVVTADVERYLSLGKPASAASVFAEAYHRRPVVFSLNLVVRCFSRHGFHRELLHLYRQLCSSGSYNFTFSPVIKACTAVSCLWLGREVHCMVLRTGHSHNVGVQTALLDMYAKAGQIDVSRRVFDGMVQRDFLERDNLGVCTQRVLPGSCHGIAGDAAGWFEG
jgi:pentatricopeptide repeat protein